MDWLFLVAGTLTAVLANIMIKASNGMENVILGYGAFILFGVSIYLYMIAVKTIPISVAYPVWSGVGVLAITAVGYFMFSEGISGLKILFISMILIGCIGLNLISKSS